MDVKFRVIHEDPERGLYLRQAILDPHPTLGHARVVAHVGRTPDEGIGFRVGHELTPGLIEVARRAIIRAMHNEQQRQSAEQK